MKLFEKDIFSCPIFQLFTVYTERSIFDVRLPSEQPSEVFYKKGCSLKLRNIHRKTPVQEFFNTPTLVLFCEYCEIFKNTHLKKHLQTTASVNSITVLFQESIALSFKQSALTSGICNLGELVQQTQVQTGSRGFYFPSTLEKFSKFRAQNTCFVFSNLQSFYFSLFCAQSLVKTFPKWKYIFSFSILKWHIIVQTIRNNKLLFKDEHSYN